MYGCMDDPLSKNDLKAKWTQIYDIPLDFVWVGVVNVRETFTYKNCQSIFTVKQVLYSIKF